MTFMDLVRPVIWQLSIFKTKMLLRRFAILKRKKAWRYFFPFLVIGFLISLLNHVYEKNFMLNFYSGWCLLLHFVVCYCICCLLLHFVNFDQNIFEIQLMQYIFLCYTMSVTFENMSNWSLWNLRNKTFDHWSITISTLYRVLITCLIMSYFLYHAPRLSTSKSSFKRAGGEVLKKNVYYIFLIGISVHISA